MRNYTKWKTERENTGSLLRLPGRRLTLELSVLTISSSRTWRPRGSSFLTTTRTLTGLCSKTRREATAGTDTDKKGPSLTTSLSKGRYFQVWWPRWICRGPDFLLHLQVNAASRPSTRTCLYTCSMPLSLSTISPQDGLADRQDKNSVCSRLQAPAWGSRSSAKTVADSAQHRIFQPNTSEETRQVITLSAQQTTNKHCNPCFQRY